MARKRGCTELVVVALAGGSTWAAAASAAGCSVRHVARLASDLDVKRRVTEARGVILDRAMGTAADRLSGAVGVLAEVMGDTTAPPAARVSAAAKLIDAVLRLRDELDTEQRLARLEQRSSATPRE